MTSSTALARVLDRFGRDEPAVVVGALAGGELTAYAVSGLASLEHGVPATPTTVFDLASVSKQVTSTCLLLLEDDGLLDLDDDLRDHLPGLRLREPVTLRQCAQHTGGLREYMAVNALVGAGPPSWRTEELVVRQLSAYRETDFPPGSQWSYSNTGYIALAAVVRAVRGSSLASFAAERVLGPLGMTDSRFQDDAGAVVPRKASGYAREGDRFRRADSPDEVVGDGGLLTTLVDLARWHRFLSDGYVLGPSVRDRLLTRAVLADGQVLPYAHGIEHQLVAGHPAVGHGGSIEGFRAHLLHLTQQGIGVAVLANRSDADVAALAREAVLALLGAVGTAAPEPAPVPAAGPVDGLWLAPREDTFLSTVQDGDDLVVELGHVRIPFVAAGRGAWRPESLGADVAVRIRGDELELTLGEDDWNATTYERVEPGSSAPEGIAGTYRSAELGALAAVSEGPDGLVLAVGAAAAEPLLPVRPDLLRTARHTVRCERDPSGQVSALHVSGGRMRRVRFDAAPGVQVSGFPIALGGPLPD